LDVNCSSSFVGFSILIYLNDEEINQYISSSFSYIDQLVNDVQQHTLSKYKERNLSVILTKRLVIL
ncbi:MAG: hypothetical protein K2P85_00370, partial [Flavobacteriaceae bacterium]|nr:hypothetical protein [Flavobacteriaceae bacterium]